MSSPLAMSSPRAMSSRLLVLGREQQERECALLLHDVRVTRNQSCYLLEGVLRLRSGVAHKFEASAEFAFSSLRLPGMSGLELESQLNSHRFRSPNSRGLHYGPR